MHATTNFCIHSQQLLELKTALLCKYINTSVWLPGYSGFAINAGSIFRPVIKGQRSKLYNSSFFVGSVMTKNLSVDSI